MAKLSEIRNDYINHSFTKLCPVCGLKLKSTTSRHSYKEDCSNGHRLWFFKDSRTLNLDIKNIISGTINYSINKNGSMILYKDGEANSITIYPPEFELSNCDGYIKELIQNAMIL
mgnify:CR=1 FL=1